MTLTHLKGIVRFKVAGQNALPKWQQTALRDALAKADAPPEALRFQCRIATDAQDNLKLVNLPDGETLTLHPKSRPQFGKNHRGQAYLTATMTYSGDGENYTIRWLGENVPPKMREVAVKHDKGVSVSPVTIALDLSKAEVTPSWKYHSGPERSSRSHAAEKARAEQRRVDGKPKREYSTRHCARLTDADLVASD